MCRSVPHIPVRRTLIRTSPVRSPERDFLVTQARLGLALTRAFIADRSSLLSDIVQRTTLVQAGPRAERSVRCREPLAIQGRMQQTGVMAEPHSVEPAPSSPAVHAAEAVERASDSDRDRAVSLLRDHCVVGRLTLDEFSERTGSALAARTRASSTRCSPTCLPSRSP